MRMTAMMQQVAKRGWQQTSQQQVEVGKIGGQPSVMSSMRRRSLVVAVSGSGGRRRSINSPTISPAREWLRLSINEKKNVGQGGHFWKKCKVEVGNIASSTKTMSSLCRESAARMEGYLAGITNTR